MAWRNEYSQMVNGKCRRIRVDVVAYDERFNVLVYRDPKTGAYQFPGGGLDNEESLSMAAQRELLEEAGWVGGHVSFPITEETIYQPDVDIKVDQWLLDSGYEEEKNIIVKVALLRHDWLNPAHGCERDALNYVLTPLQIVVGWLENNLNTPGDTNRNRLYNAQRLVVLKDMLEEFQRIQMFEPLDEDSPVFKEW